MIIYLAGQYNQKEQIKKYADSAREKGVEVRAQWLDERHSPNMQLTHLNAPELETYARLDLEDIRGCDVLVFFSESDETYTRRGGRHVEFGYALAYQIPIVVVGPKENIFHYISNRVRHFEDWPSALNALISLSDKTDPHILQLQVPSS